MKSKQQHLLLLIFVIALVFSSVSATLPQTPAGNCRYFAQTGHYVCDEFLEFFENYGAEEIFGYPLTQAYTDPNTGMWIQYFQRHRMELHPENPEPYNVLLGLLTDELGYAFPNLPEDQIPPYNSALQRYFPETKHIVSYAFLEYFEEHGGIFIFGYPRSEYIFEDGQVVQYFQRARMEWHPEKRPEEQVSLTNVGEIYIEQYPPPPQHLEPGDDPNVPVETQLEVTASVRHAIAGRNGTQTVFVYILDQTGQPVEGAAVSMVVNYQSGAQTHDFSPTNESGFTRQQFPIAATQPGQKVIIDVTATYRKLTATTQTFFLPWW